ncbi:response regulator [Acidobacteriota bacterium]
MLEAKSILIVDDDRELCELVIEYLEQEGFAVEAVFDGEKGAAKAIEGDFALVVLDVMLPGLNGFEILRRIRAHSQVPVLMLTARGEEIDRIVGLEIGADDYMAKPFNPRELAARMRAILRRVDGSVDTTAAPGQQRMQVGDLTLDLGAREAFLGNEALPLTGIELSLLEFLVRSAGRVVNREDLSRAVLGRRANPFDRSLDVHMSNLRKKIGPLPGGGVRIKTVRGRGYQYVKPSESS